MAIECTSQPNRFSGAAVIVVLGFLTAIAAIGFGQTSHLQRSLRLDDDNLYLYCNGLRLLDRAGARALDEEILAGYERTDATEHLVFRYTSRADHAYNYLVSTGSIMAGQLIWQPSAEAGGTEFNNSLVRALMFGFVLSGVLAAVLTLVAMGFTRSSLLICAFALSLTVTLVIDSSLVDRAYHGLTGNPVPPAYPSILGVGKPVKLALLQLVRPLHGFTPLGFLSKSHLWLLIIPIYALRWRQRYAVAYGLLFVLAMFHSTMTGVLTAMFIVVDAIVRPRMVLGRPVVFLAGGLVALHLLREQLWGVVFTEGAWMGLLGGAVLVVGGALGVLVWHTRADLAALKARIARVAWARPKILDQPDTSGRVLVELCMITGIWLVTFPIAAVINGLVGPLQSLYFWSHLHGRMIAAIRPGLIMGTVYLGLLLWQHRAGAARRSVLPAASLAIALVVVVAIGMFELRQRRTPIKRMTWTTEWIDGHFTPIEVLGFADELWIYYGVARTLQTDVDAINVLFPSPPASGQ